MQKRLSLVLAVLLLFAALAFGAVAENVEGQEITLSLTAGDRTGVYTGEMQDGVPHGTGKFESESPDGTAWYYQGEFVDGHFCGQGTMVFATGERKVGQFERDMLNGQGKYYVNDELRYEGGWVDDQFSGQGTAYDGNEKWVGEFQNGTLNGEATHYVDGVVRAKGTWKNGSLSKGTMYNENGEWAEEVGLEDAGPLAVFFAIIFIVLSFGLVFGMPTYIIVSANKRRKAQEQFAREQWLAAQAQIKAAQEEERKKQAGWTCAACGATNPDGHVCEYCGTSRYAK